MYKSICKITNHIKKSKSRAKTSIVPETSHLSKVCLACKTYFPLLGYWEVLYFLYSGIELKPLVFKLI